jgi:hypothetical protein
LGIIIFEMPPKDLRKAQKQLSALRSEMTDLKKNIANPDFVRKFKQVRESAMDLYRDHAGIVTMEDLKLFGILVNKEGK